MATCRLPKVLFECGRLEMRYTLAPSGEGSMNTTLATIQRVAPGLAFVAVLALCAVQVASLEPFTALRISPIVIGIVIGAVIGNLAGPRIPGGLDAGVMFAAKKVLRLAIVLYGFRITFTQIADVGLAGFVLDATMVFGTLVFGTVIGTRWLGMDKATAILTSAGAAICGAAAIVATEPIVKAEPHKTAIAIGTVVIFGTTAMFLYPLAYRAEWLPMTEEAFGMYVGATVHGVAHVVGAGEAVGPVAAGTAVIVKMTRVMLLAPALVAIGWLYNRRVDGGSDSPVAIPWFAVGFVAVAGFNSLSVLSADAVALIVRIDAFLLTVAMTALGLNTVVSKFKGIGWQPIKLGFVLAVWLIVFGFLATSALVASDL